YGINISRVMRSGVQLLATPGLILQLGDRLPSLPDFSDTSYEMFPNRQKKTPQHIECGVFFSQILKTAKNEP
uniref:hypothetical protein n=1 Tax=Alistipes putredinis TaxID=28117 RepID=UPI003AB50EAA